MQISWSCTDEQYARKHREQTAAAQTWLYTIHKCGPQTMPGLPVSFVLP